MKITKKQLRNIIKESTDYSDYLLEEILLKLKIKLENWYMIRNKNIFPESALISTFKAWLNHGNFRKHINILKLETGISPIVIKNIVIDNMMNYLSRFVMYSIYNHPDGVRLARYFAINNHIDPDEEVFYEFGKNDLTIM